MKNKLLLPLFLLVFSFTNAQFEVKDSSNNLITDGQNIAFSDENCGYGDPCNWKFKVTNTGTEDIYMQINCTAMDNTNGQNFQLCFAGVCLNSVSVGGSYPNQPALIAAGATNSAGNSMWNQNSDGSTKSWSFSFQQTDSSGNPIGSPLNIDYTFDPNLSAASFEDKINLSVYPTVTENTINVSTQQNLNLKIYNILGKTVKNLELTSGTSEIDLSDLASQPYILRFTNDRGEKLTKKIVIK